MKIIKQIKQESTGLTFDISSCNFYSDVVHYDNDEFGTHTIITNGDWSFVEQEPFNVTLGQMIDIEKAKRQKRDEVIAESKVLFPNLKHNLMSHISLVMNQEDTVEVIHEIYGKDGLSIEEIQTFVTEYHLQKQRHIEYIQSEFDRLGLHSLVNNL